MIQRPFFVYGTLKVGGALSHRFDEFRETCVDGRLLNYSIYDLGWFPGILDDGDGEVFGEIHTYSPENYKDVLNTFDAIEGYSEHNSSRSLYIRKVLNVIDEAGNEISCNCYVLNNNRRNSMSKFEPLPEKMWDVAIRQR